MALTLILFFEGTKKSSFGTVAFDNCSCRRNSCRVQRLEWERWNTQFVTSVGQRKKIWVPDGNHTHDLPYTSRSLWKTRGKKSNMIWNLVWLTWFGTLDLYKYYNHLGDHLYVSSGFCVGMFILRWLVHAWYVLSSCFVQQKLLKG